LKEIVRRGTKKRGADGRHRRGQYGVSKIPAKLGSIKKTLEMENGKRGPSRQGPGGNISIPPKATGEGIGF